MGRGDTNKLYLMSFDGRDPHVVNNSIDTRGRSDWSINNLITFDMGGPFQHDVYTMNVDGSNLDKFSDGTDQRQLTKNDYCDYQPRWGN